MPTRDGKTLLTPEDWTRAALDAIGEGGVSAVAVDRLAKRLRASRGSFYWHFKDRADVIDAALELWARENTTDLLPGLDAIADPVERLRALLRAVYERPVDAVELTLSAAGDDPIVGPAVARVTNQRIDVLGGSSRISGCPPRRRATAPGWPTPSTSATTSSPGTPRRRRGGRAISTMSSNCSSRARRTTPCRTRTRA